MKHPTNVLLLVTILFILGCYRYDDFSNPIDGFDLNLGEHVVFVNGVEDNFTSADSVLYFPQSDKLRIIFSKEYQPPINARTSFSFNRIPLSEKEFEIRDTEDPDSNIEVSISIFSPLGIDEAAAEYKLSKRKEGNFIVLELDEANQTVKGSFKFKMKMTNDNGFSAEEIGLPEFCTMEGGFYKAYF